METSESDNEDFQSADEFVSDEETNKTVKIIDPLPKPPEIKEPCVVPRQTSPVDPVVTKNIDNESATDESGSAERFRKRPERKRPPEEPRSKIIRPDAILSDLTGHLTSEFSRGFASLTTTSSSLGSKVGSLVKEIVSVKDEQELEFEYDDDRTVENSEPVRSAINDEIMKLSDAFVKLNEARAKEFEIDNGWDACKEKDDDKEVNVVVEEINEELKNDGWEDWGDVESEATRKPEEAEELAETTKEEKKDGNDGWEDWGGEESAATRKLEEAEELAETTKEEKKDGNDGWDDWGDDVIAEKDDDGWGDWGDDYEEIKPQKRQLGSASAKPAAEWSGWDSFGQKKETTWSAGWGINSLLSTATAVTSNLSQGISTVIESGLGVPDPETMARIQKEELAKRVPTNTVQQPEPDLFPFKQIVGKIVEVQEIGSRVLTGGLDTLETIGKKTMEVLQEGDPGLKKKRALIINKGQMLSQVLKEARDRARTENKNTDGTVFHRQFETVFDDFQGLVHLEALEMLSKQCEIQLDTIKQSSAPHKLQELLDTLEEVNQLCEIDEEFDHVDFEDFQKDVKRVSLPLKNELSVEKILHVHERLYDWLASKAGKETPVDQIYDEAISTIAELTAAVTMQFHKSGELLLLKERRKTVEEADCLLQLSSHLCAELKIITEKCVELFKDGTKSDILVSNLRVESENAVSYVKQAFRLLVPVLQLGAT